MPLENGTWVDWDIINTSVNKTVLDLARYNNEITGNMFWPLALLSLFFIFFMITSYYKTKVSLQSSLGMTTVLAFLLWSIGLVGTYLPVVFMIAFAGSMALLWGDKT